LLDFDDAGRVDVNETRRDVIVVGGGPIGMALALALRSAFEMRITLVDARNLAIPTDHRATAISAGVSAVFEALGVWDDMAKTASPIRAMKLTDSEAGAIYRPLLMSFAGEVAPGRPLAHMVPNQAMAKVLSEAVRGRGIEVVAGTVGALEFGRDALWLTLKDGSNLAAAAVAAADGGRSAMRGMAGIGALERDYGQSGLVTSVRHDLPHEGVAWQHFLPGGPLASLPLEENRSSLVWTERSAEAARLVGLERDRLGAEIEARMGSRLGKVTVEEDVQAFPLRLVIARRMVAARLALVGDAAHVIHPLAGQGLNLGMKDVAALAEVLVEAARIGEDIGAGQVLERYQRWRRFDVMRMAGVTDGINRLFSNDNELVRAARDTGLGIVERLPRVKTALIAEAAGKSGGSGPRLLRGLAI
jgi:2-octaprenyl-6-methoxyphenol hydroxylase